MQKISVVIPTHNRCKILLNSLRYFENQTISKEDYELVIVENEPRDNTEKEIENFINNSFLDIRYFKINQKSASKARNIGILNARYDLILNTDDDIIASTNLLEEHLRFHQNFNLNEDIAVLGYTSWHSSLRITNFMRFINEYGPQFGYKLIKDETNLPSNYFYSSNISISKKVLLVNGVFDEDFPEYWYDIELGYRLKQKGLRIMLNKNAAAYHLHPTSIFSFLKRQQKVGYYAVLFYLKHTELKNFLIFSKNNNSFFATKTLKGSLKVLNPLYRFYALLINLYYRNGIAKRIRALRIQFS